MMGPTAKQLGEAILSSNNKEMEESGEMQAFARLAVSEIPDILAKWFEDEWTERKTDTADILAALARFLGGEIAPIAEASGRLGLEDEVLDRFIRAFSDMSKARLELEKSITKDTMEKIRKDPDMSDEIKALSDRDLKFHIVASVVKGHARPNVIVDVESSANKPPSVSRMEEMLGMTISGVRLRDAKDEDDGIPRN